MPLLFSYGSLQDANVQLSTFGRRLYGHADEIVGFESSLVRIEDPELVKSLGRAHHANVTFNGREDSRVPGTVFEVTEDELSRVDDFEGRFAYKRVAARLGSGHQAWVYVGGQGR
jgi:hypothetical protein